MIFIHGNIPSFKNSKQWTGKFLIPSKTVTKYLKGYEYQWKEIPYDFQTKETQLKIGFHFVRGTKHRWDFINAVQLPADLMVKYGWIEDDDVEHFLPVPLEVDGKYFSYNKDNPGVYIKILQQ